MDNSPTPGSPSSGDRFYMLVGDGDPDFFNNVKYLTLVEVNWFDGRIRDKDALLFRIDDGNYSGRYVALSARSTESIISLINQHGYSSVIVHLIHNPTSSFDENSNDRVAIGMSMVNRIGTQ